MGYKLRDYQNLLVDLAEDLSIPEPNVHLILFRETIIIKKIFLMSKNFTLVLNFTRKTIMSC